MNTSILAPVLTVALLGALGALSARFGGGAREAFPGVREWRASRAWTVSMAVCGAGFLGFAVWGFAVASPNERWAPWGFLAFAAFAFLVSAQLTSWRVIVDDAGIHVRRLLFGARDVPWSEVGALSVTRSRYMAGQVGEVAVMTLAGRRAASVSGTCLGGDAAQEAFLEEARRRGVPVVPPSELPAGLTSWGPVRRWLEGLRSWQQALVAVSATLLITAAGLLLVLWLCSATLPHGG